jgi:hypothetical protein
VPLPAIRVAALRVAEDTPGKKAIGHERRILRGTLHQLWFKRDEQFIGDEARKLIERFTNVGAMLKRQRALDDELTEEGWTGPHGWNL